LPLAEAGIILLPNVIDHKFTEFEIEKKGDRGNYKQYWYRTDLKIKVKWINADNPSDFIESDSAAFALDTSDKGFAKAYSLALKIALLKVHLLESYDEEEKREFQDDVDGNDYKKRDQMPPLPPMPNKMPDQPPNQSFDDKTFERPPVIKTPTQSQLARLYAIGSENGWDSDSIRLYSIRKVKRTPGQLSKVQYEQLCDFLTKNKCDFKMVEEIEDIYATLTDEEMALFKK